MSSPSLAGQLQIALHPDHGVQIGSSRPNDLTRHFIGLTPAEVQQRVPLLFALCGKAQARAAALALNAAGAALVEPPAAAVWIEAAQEYLWRFAIDLPRWAGQPPEMAAFAALRKALRESPEQAAETLQNYLNALLFESVRNWQQRDGRTLEDWLQSSESPAARLLRKVEQTTKTKPYVPVDRLLPAFPAPPMLNLLGDAMAKVDFCVQPSWKTCCAETSALAYQLDHPWIKQGVRDRRPGALLRLMARLLELGMLLTRLEGRGVVDSGSERLAEQTAIGWVHTARGLLLHRVELEQGQIRDYAILAPTEWNFHPEGALKSALQPWSQVNGDQRQHWAELEILALDPCVAYQLEVYDA